MNRTTTVVVALIAAAGLSTMVYAVPEQRALAWGGFGGFGGCGFGCGGCGFGCGGGFFDGCGGFGGCGGCGFGCGGGFFGDGFHKTIIQTIHQVNNCSSSDDEDHKGYGNDNRDQNNRQVVCVNTATNTARHGFGGFG
jgi:hypothetical protein